MSSREPPPESRQSGRVDLAFRLVGDRIPVDHGYTLYSALCRSLPVLHDGVAFGLLPFWSTPQEPGWLQLGPQSRLGLRIGPSDIPTVIGLAGKRIGLDGVVLSIGVPEVFPLRPSERLVSRIVTIKGFADDEKGFREACQRQLDAMGVEAASVEIGRRRVMRVRGYTVVGFGVLLDRLSPEASVTVQCVGIGGKRKMGAGVFVAAADK